MIEYDTNSRLQLARQHADTLAAEMRRTRRITRSEAGLPGWGRLAEELLARAERLRRGKGRHAPVYDA